MGATFVMSYPSADWQVAAGENPRSKAARGTPSNPRRALTEWIALADAIVLAQGRILVVDPPKAATGTPPLTGLPFTSDWGALIRRNDEPIFLQARGSVAHRAAEADVVRALFTAAGVQVQPIAAAWGGRSDLLQIGPGRYLYLSGTRSEAGASQIIAKELGNTVRYMEARVAPPFTFGDEVAAMVRNRAGDGMLLVHEAGMLGRTIPELRSAFNNIEVVAVDADDADAGACTALAVNGTVILPTGLSTQLRGHLARRGAQLVELDLPELFGRGGGGAHALANELVGFVIGAGAPDYLHARDRILALVDTYPEKVG